jgi:hypothetical protein
MVLACVWRFLNESVLNKWIGRGFLAWPPQSPHLTSLEFLLGDNRHLEHLVTEMLATVNKVMFVDMWSEIEYHFDVC